MTNDFGPLDWNDLLAVIAAGIALGVLVAIVLGWLGWL
jgi:hypothetical protein